MPRLAKDARGRASVAAGIAAALVFVTTAWLVATDRFTKEKGAQVTTTVTTTVKSAPGWPSETVTSESAERKESAADSSLLGRAFDSEGTRFLFGLFLASLAAFGTGALVQRVILGEYGITVGPVAIPPLPPVTADSAGRALELITESPEIGPILAPGARGVQPAPLSDQVEDASLRLVSVRIDLEIRLRELAEAAGMDRDIALSRLPERLVKEGVVSAATADGVKALLEICDRIVAGAQVADAARTQLLGQSADVLYALGELARVRAEAIQPARR